MTANRPALWIVVDDAAEARIYASHPRQLPVLVDQLARDGADRPGLGSTTALAVARDHFAIAIGALLDRGCAARRFDRLAIVMAPRLLGRVRAHLGADALAAIIATLDRRLNDGPADHIVRRIADARLVAHP